MKLPCRLLGISIALSLLLGCKNRPGSEESTTASISDTCDNSTFVSHTTNAVKVGGQALRPNAVLVYYAIDTREPFMQWAVDDEIRALRRSCVASQPGVNWIAFTNSYYVGDGSTGHVPSFLMCKGGSGADQVWALPQSLVSSIEAKRTWLTKHRPGDADSPLHLEVPYPTTAANDFGAAPLAHPDVLHDIMGYVAQQFPPEAYTPFLQLKSHGSNTFVLTGLTASQVQAKEDCQKGILNDKGLTAPDIQYAHVGLGGLTGAQLSPQAAPVPTQKLGEVGLGEVGLGQVGLGQVGLGQVGLGEVGLGQVGLGEVGLGEVGLSADHPLGLGTAGLGEHGLNATNHFGSPATFVLAALYDVPGSNGSDLYWGFLMLESCDSQIAQDSFPGRLLGLTKRVDAYYSANGALWYRNLNWDSIFSSWSKGSNPNATSLQALLLDQTSKIPNYAQSN